MFARWTSHFARIRPPFTNDEAVPTSIKNICTTPTATDMRAYHRPTRWAPVVSAGMTKTYSVCSWNPINSGVRIGSSLAIMIMGGLSIFGVWKRIKWCVEQVSVCAAFAVLTAAVRCAQATVVVHCRHIPWRQLPDGQHDLRRRRHEPEPELVQF